MDSETPKTPDKPRSIYADGRMPDISDFKICVPISRGAFGKVFIGHKLVDPSQRYAIKVLKKSEIVHKNMVDQMITERDALAQIKSPFCVQLFYSLQNATHVFLVMEFLIGGDLKSLCTFGCLTERLAAFYMAELVLALDYLHSHGIIHRDVKPDNLLLDNRGHLKLTDFGLSKISGARNKQLARLASVTPSIKGKAALKYVRTPGQILSLTSHLSFKSEGNTSIGCSPVAATHTRPPDASVSGAPDTPLTALKDKDLTHLKRQFDFNSSMSPLARASPVHSKLKSRHSLLASRNESDLPVPACDFSQQSITDTPTAQQMDTNKVVNSDVKVIEQQTHAVKDSQVNEEAESKEDNFTMECDDKLSEDGSNSQSSSESKLSSKSDEAQTRDSTKDDDTEFIKRPTKSSHKKVTGAGIGEKHRPLPPKLHSRLKALSGFTDHMSPVTSQSSDSRFVNTTVNSDIIDPADINTSSPILHNKFLHKLKAGRVETSSPILPLGRDFQAPMSSASNVKATADSGFAASGTEFNTGSNFSSILTDMSAIEKRNQDDTVLSSIDKENISKSINKFESKAEYSESRKKVLADANDVFKFPPPTRKRTISSDSPVKSKKKANLGSDCSREEHSVSRGAQSTETITPGLHDDTSDCPPLTRKNSGLTEDLSNIAIQKTVQGAEQVAELALTEKSLASTMSTPERATYTSIETMCHSPVASAVDSIDNFKTEPVVDEEIEDLEYSSDSEMTIETPLEVLKAAGAKISPRSYLPARYEDDDSVEMCDQVVQKDDKNLVAGDEFNRVGNNEMQLMKGTDSSKPQQISKTVRWYSETNISVGNVQPSAKRRSIAEGGRSSHASKDIASTSFENFHTPVRRGTNAGQFPPNTPIIPHSASHSKTLRKRQQEELDKRVLGTPDYLAPELLLRQEHGAPVDWWAAGVCLFEFLTSNPPFNDNSAAAVFQNILDMKIPWPKKPPFISEESKEVILSLLAFEPEDRAVLKDLRGLKFFENIDWENIHETTAEFIPQVDHDMDTFYFSGRNKAQNLKVSGIDL